MARNAGTAWNWSGRLNECGIWGRQVPSKKTKTASTRRSKGGGLPHLERNLSAGEVYLYYRRGGKRIALPGPEGCEAFRIAYDAAAARFAPKVETREYTVAGAIDAYLSSADFRQLSDVSKRDYSFYFRVFRRDFGDVSMRTLDTPNLAKIRDTYAGEPNKWNALRARMTAATDHFIVHHPHIITANPWRLSKRLKVKQSDANKPWPADVLTKVFEAASPEFRALLTGYLLTAQRGGDVTTFERRQHDPEARTIVFRQSKTDAAMTLHVPDALAVAIGQMEDWDQRASALTRQSVHGLPAGHPNRRLFLTERGYPWTLDNAQQMLAALLKRIHLPRYTLHGLRSTGPSALRQLGVGNAHLRGLTGHSSDSNLEVYLRHADKAPVTREAQEALAMAFSGVLKGAGGLANADCQNNAKSVPDSIEMASKLLKR
jgi:integrase